MSLVLDLGNTDNIYFDGNDVEILKLNNDIIWTKGAVVSDSLVFNCSSVYFEEESVSDISQGYHLWFGIKAIENTTITFNDYSLTLVAGESQTVKVVDGAIEQQTGDLRIEGQCEFTTINESYEISGYAGTFYFKPFKLNEIKQWKTTLDYIPTYFLTYSNFEGSTDVYIPSNIKKVGGVAFGINGEFSNSNIYLPDNLEQYSPDSFGRYNPPLNAVNDGTMIYIDNRLIIRATSSTETDGYVIADGTIGLPSGSLWLSDTTKSITLNNDGALKRIPASCFLGKMSLISLVIPESITEIGDSAFSGCTSLTTLTFNTPASVEMTLGTSLFGSNKTARSVTIYTDNETIKNYDYGTDNITPTFYHLDGTAWE